MAVQWLGLLCFRYSWVQSLVRKLRSQKAHSQRKNFFYISGVKKVPSYARMCFFSLACMKSFFFRSPLSRIHLETSFVLLVSAAPNLLILFLSSLVLLIWGFTVSSCRFQQAQKVTLSRAQGPSSQPSWLVMSCSFLTIHGHVLYLVINATCETPRTSLQTPHWLSTLPSGTFWAASWHLRKLEPASS